MIDHKLRPGPPDQVAGTQLAAFGCRQDVTTHLEAGPVGSKQLAAPEDAHELVRGVGDRDRAASQLATVRTLTRSRAAQSRMVRPRVNLAVRNR